MFCCIADDGHEDDADEHIAQAPGLGGMFDRANEKLAQNGHKHRRDNQDNDRFLAAPGRFCAATHRLFESLFAVFRVFADIKMRMGTQAENQAEDVADEQHHGNFQTQLLLMRFRRP